MRPGNPVHTEYFVSFAVARECLMSLLVLTGPHSVRRSVYVCIQEKRHVSELFFAACTGFA